MTFWTDSALVLSRYCTSFIQCDVLWSVHDERVASGSDKSTVAAQRRRRHDSEQEQSDFGTEATADLDRHSEQVIHAEHQFGEFYEF